MMNKAFRGILIIILAQMLPCSADGRAEAITGKNALVAGDNDTAIRLLSRALDEGLSADVAAIALTWRGIAYSRKGLQDQAILDFNSALKFNPDNQTTHSNRGTAFARKGLYEQAIADYNEALHQDSKDVNTYIGRGLVNIYLGHYDKAFVDLDLALRYSPDNASVFAHRGYGHFRMGLYDQAINDYTDALHIKPDNAGALGARGRILYVLGKFEAASTDFAKAHTLSPDNLYFLIWQFLADSRIGGNRRNELIQEMRDVADRAWPYPILDFLAERSSKDELITAANAPGNAENRNHLCEAWFYVGEVELIHSHNDSAQQMFRRAKDTCPITFTEFDMATAELGRLKKEPKFPSAKRGGAP